MDEVVELVLDQPRHLLVGCLPENSLRQLFRLCKVVGVVPFLLPLGTRLELRGSGGIGVLGERFFVVSRVR